MSYVGVKFNNAIRKIAGMAIMDVAFSNTSINGVQNKVIKAKFDEIESINELVATNVVSGVTIKAWKAGKTLTVLVYGGFTTTTENEAIGKLPITLPSEEGRLFYSSQPITGNWLLLAPDGTINLRNAGNSGNVNFMLTTICN